MKTFKLLFISLCLTLVLPQANAQANEVPPGIITALNAGNASALSGFLHDNVELVIGSQNDVFSKQQATGIISDFFRKNKVVDFVLIHKGNKESACFAIGTLKTSTGNFRVYVLTRKNGIQQLRIESSND